MDEIWTLSSLKEYIDNRVDGLHQRIDELSNERHREHDKFADDVERRFSQVNEFRGSLDDLGKTMATRRELEDLRDVLASQLQEHLKQITELRSRIDVGPAALPDLRSRLDIAGGRQEGVKLTTGMLFGGLAAIAAFISIVVVIANVWAAK